MKRIITFSITVLLVFYSSLYAREYKFNKEVNPSQLAEELKASGINLLGKDQIGYMETTNGKEIRIVVKNGVSIDEVGLQDVISSHKPKDYEVERKANEDKAIVKLKGLGLTDAEVKALLRQ